MSITWYVSKQSGNDANSGSGSITAAKSSIQSVLNLVSSGDYVYIGPGTYREALSTIKSGGDSNRIKVIGDPDCFVLSSDTPGFVRVTATTVNDVVSLSGTSNYLFDMTGYKNYEVYNMLFDGQGYGSTGTSLNAFGIRGAKATIGNNYFYNCSIQNMSYCGAYDVVLDDCYVQAGRYGTWYCHQNNCVIGGGETAVYGQSTAQGITVERSKASNCITLGGAQGAQYSVMINCTNIGGTYSYWRCQTHNSLAFNSLYGFYDQNNVSKIVDNCFASGVEYGSRLCNSLSATSTAYWDNVGIDPSYETGTSATMWRIKPLARYDGWKTKDYIKKAFEPLMYTTNGLSACGNVNNPSSAIGSFDILKKNRQMGVGSTKIDIGAYALSNIQERFESGYYYNNAPGFYFTNIGQKNFDIYASTGDLTISAWIKNTGGSTVIMGLTGTNIPYSSFNVDNLTGDWEAASVTASITGGDQRLLLTFLNQSTSTTAMVSDIRVY